jgi:homoserine O-acetyltransferase/O-succinyltransferase
VLFPSYFSGTSSSLAGFVGAGELVSVEIFRHRGRCIRVAIPIVGSPRLTGYDLLLWHAEEDALRSDPAWQNGHYTQRPPMGLVDAIHTMHLTTPANYAREHPPEKFAADYAAYYSNGILPFDANDWLSQSR